MISIIIPVYNAEKYLNNCFTCLQRQSFNDFEVFWIDDGSTDSSGQMIDTFAQKDKRMQAIHKKNGGASTARNVGLSKASGDYICFVDADDSIHPDYLKILYETINQSGCDIVQCGYKRSTQEELEITTDGKQSKNLPEEIQYFTNIEFLNKIYTSEAVDTIVLWNKIYRREILTGLSFFEGIMFEDEVFSAKAIYRASKIGQIEDVLYYYLYNEESVMNRNYSYRMLDILKALQLRMEFYQEHDLKDLYERDGYKCLYKILLNYYEIDRLPDKHREILKELRKKYWEKYKEALSFKWSWKRKLLMFFFGIFPKRYMKFYQWRNR